MIQKLRNLLNNSLTKETLAYLFFGGLTTLVSLVSFKVCLTLDFSLVVSNVISTILAVTFAFFTNKIWVFQSKDFAKDQVTKEFLKFITGRFFTFLVDTGLLLLLDSLLKVDPMLTKTFIQVVVIILNYIISKKAVFRK